MFATSTLPLLSLHDLKPVQTAQSFVDDDLNKNKLLRWPVTPPYKCHSFMSQFSCQSLSISHSNSALFQFPINNHSCITQNPKTCQIFHSEIKLLISKLNQTILVILACFIPLPTFHLSPKNRFRHKGRKRGLSLKHADTCLSALVR